MRRKRARMREDLPDPVRPTMPAFCPPAMDALSPATASGSALDEPVPDMLSPEEPGAVDARDRPSFFQRIVRCEAPAADCVVM